MKTKWMMIAGLSALCGMAQAAFVTIGDAGNTADTTGYGAVGYTYQISATEVTIAEFAASGAGSGNENYWNDGDRTVGANAPASVVTWYEAAKYCNWLTSGNVSLGAYQFDGGGTLTNVMTRTQILADGGLFYVLPTEDEWYKAAYFKPDASGYSLYANGTDTVPIWGTTDGWNYHNGTDFVNGDPNRTWAVGSGGVEQNGTYDMMGNLWEWNESAWDGMLDDMAEWRVMSGGAFYTNEVVLSSSSRRFSDPSLEYDAYGFRVVAIPEPASAMLVFFGAGVGMAIHRARRSAMRR
jgi:formylglycine-generating enzyme required for sulfatase activity